MFKAKLALRPNCLLTRRPLLFLTPTRSLFFYNQVWQPTVDLLTEHGYKATELALPFQNHELKIKYLEKIQTQLQYSHLWLDEVTYQETRSFFEDFLPHSSSTLTILTTQKNQQIQPHCYSLTTDSVTPSLSYWFHTLWNQWKQIPVMPAHAYISQINTDQRDRLLDHCIDLAELDFNLD